MLTKLVYTDELCLSVRDRIFLGEGLFETIAVVAGKPCYAVAHWQRLTKSARALQIPFDVDQARWEAFLMEGISRIEMQKGGLKLILASGSADRGLLAQSEASLLVLQAFQYQVHSAPLHLLKAPWCRDAANPLYGFKHINYLEAIAARRWAKAQGGDEILFFNTLGKVMEASCANLFICQNNVIKTPKLSDGVLPGITRARVLKEATKLGFAVEEQSLTEADLLAAEGVFLTNALQGIQLVRSYEGHQFAVDSSIIEALKAQSKINSNRI